MNQSLVVVFALYPGVTQLDFTGPLQVLSRVPGAKVELCSLTGGALSLAPGFDVVGLAKLEAIERCSLLCVPGGYGTIEMLREREYVRQIVRLGRMARYVTSVCTGSLLLAAAGLLDGKRAACHWAWRDLLAEFGVTVDSRRVVRDGNVFTGGGVTAGIDLALTVVAEIAGREFAECVQLGLEYAPEPPWDSGRPELASPQVVAQVKQRLETLGAGRVEAVKDAVRNLRAL